MEYSEIEKSYNVMFSEDCYLKSNGKIVIGTGVMRPDNLTEKEIKGYDPRYWPFAEEVTE